MDDGGLRSSRTEVEHASFVLEDGHARSRAVRRAIEVLHQADPSVERTPLLGVIEDSRRDAITRGMAAVTLSHRVEREGSPAPTAAEVETLLHSTDRGMPAHLRRAATYALGALNAPVVLTRLSALWSDETEPDPFVRLAAGRSLTKLTGELHFSQALVEEIRNLYPSRELPPQIEAMSR